MNFSEINRVALAASYPRHLFPKASQIGRELQCGNIHGDPGHSFCVNLETGAWIDNSTDQRGGDVVSLVAAREGITQGEAARRLADELNLDPGRKPAPRPAPKSLPDAPTTGEPAHVYSYLKADGTVAFEVLRYEKPGHTKAIRIRGRHDATLLYNAAVATQYDTIFVAEGEQCVDRLAAPGVDLVAVCNPGGAGKWLPEHSQYLAGKHVVILPDNDEPGQRHAAQVAASVLPLAASVKMVNLPGLPHKGDVVDWLDAGGDVHQLAELVDAAPFYEPAQDQGPAKTSRLAVAGYGGFMTEKIAERNYMLWPVIPEQGLVMLYASRGIGKTFVALSMAVAVATGGRLFGWQAKAPRRVLYIDGEMPARTMQDRLRFIVAGAGRAPTDESFKIITPDFQPNGFMPNLSTAEGQEELAGVLPGVDFIVIDNLATLCRGGKENESDSWARMQEWLLSLRCMGKSVLLVHHAGKGGDQRGTSAKEDILDTVIKLSRPADYVANQGAKFTVELTKARGLAGPEAEPFEAMLVQDPYTDALTWEYGRKEDRDVKRVQELLDEGLTQRQIGEVMGQGWGLGTVNRFIRAHGLTRRG